MKKIIALILSLILIATLFAGCSNNSSVDVDVENSKVAQVEDNLDVEEESKVSGTVYLNSTRKGAITKAANPVIGIQFEETDPYYVITKTSTNFMVEPVSGNSEPFYVMFDSPDEVVIGDFAYGFATAISTKWEDLIHIYDFEKNEVYKVATPLHTSRIKKINDRKYAVQYINDNGQTKSMSFSTDDKYAYDLFLSTKDVVMIVDGGDEFDEAIEIAGETSGATTFIEEGNTIVHTETTANNSLKIVTETVITEETDGFSVEDEVTEVENSTSEEATIIEENKEEREEDTSEENIGMDVTDEVETIDIAEEQQFLNDEEKIDLNKEETLVNEVESDTVSVTDDEIMESVTDEAEAVQDTNEAVNNDETKAVQETIEAATEGVTEETYYVINEAELADVAIEDSSEVKHKEIENGIIIDVPLICQFPYYPTGCESVSATMALRYSGFNISVDDFINNYLDKSNDFYMEDGKRIGPSPYQYFIGSPYDASGFGCMANVIYNAFMKIYADSTRVVNASGITMDELCKDYISRDLPVVVWANISMTDAYDSNTWTLADGTEFTWRSGEHCMLLVGYDAQNYYFNDPYTGKLVSYGKDVSEKCYAQQGMQAVVIIK